MIESQKLLKKNRIGDILSVILIILSASVSLNDNLNPIALYLAIPCSFIWCFSQYRIIRTNMYVKLLLILYSWILFCSFFAEDLHLASLEMKRVLGSFILCYSIAALSSKKIIIPWLYVTYMVLLGAAWWYAKNNILSVIDFGVDRLNDQKLNANTLAYYTFYVTISVFLLGEILRGKLRILLRVALFGMVFLAFITSLYTASRQVLLLQVPLFVFLFWTRYVRGGKNRTVFFLIIAGFIWAFVNYGLETYNNSVLKQRSEIAVKDDSRYQIAKESVRLGFQSPLIGYGPGNIVNKISSHHGAHNTYLELFVNTGIFGVILFISLLCVYIKRQYKRWKQTKDNLFFAFLVFGLFWMIDQVFYAFYADLWLMSFFILVASHSDEYYYSNYYLKKYDKNKKRFELLPSTR